MPNTQYANRLIHETSLTSSNTLATPSNGIPGAAKLSKKPLRR